MQNSIIIVGGSKGGVGKSIISMSLVDYFLNKNRNFILIETDTSNPDVLKAYESTLGNGYSTCIDLDREDGWISLLDGISVMEDCDVVINTAARNNKAIAEYGAMLNGTLGDLKKSLITIWAINRQRDSVELLQEYMETMKMSSMYVFRNLYFGTKDDLFEFDSSDLRKRIETMPNGSVFDFPDLADRVTDYITSKRVPISVAKGDMPFGSRVALNTWCDKCAEIYNKIFREGERETEAKAETGTNGD